MAAILAFRNKPISKLIRQKAVSEHTWHLLSQQHDLNVRLANYIVTLEGVLRDCVEAWDQDDGSKLSGSRYQTAIGAARRVLARSFKK